MPVLLRLAAATALATVTSGCGGSTNSAGVDVSGLEHELAQVMRLAEIAHGYEFDVRAACAGNGDDLHFNCYVTGRSRGSLVTTWTIGVHCDPAHKVRGPRCLTDNGYALQ